jgi:hypothetical protein
MTKDSEPNGSKHFPNLVCVDQNYLKIASPISLLLSLFKMSPDDQSSKIAYFNINISTFKVKETINTLLHHVFIRSIFQSL